MTPPRTVTKTGLTTSTRLEDTSDSASESDDDPTQYTFTLTPDLLSTIHPTHSSLKNSLRTQTRSLGNRLRSITTDSQFVLRVAAAYALPLMPNARAGDWYVPPECRGSNTSSAYFKSTDGHPGQWGFSMRRLNLHVLECVGRHCGVVLVDSTRRGKRFPDALSRTVPVWIAVMNWCLFGGGGRGGLCVSENMVSESERVQIERLVPGFVERFLELGVDLSKYKRTITKPLRPIWVSPESTLPISPPKFEEFTPVVLLTASKMTRGEGMEGEYIQGAGDDHEGWATESGLTPTLFWHHHTKIMSAPEQDLLEVIKNLPPPSSSNTLDSSKVTRIGRTNIYIAPTSAIPTLPSIPTFYHIICTSSTPLPPTDGIKPVPSHHPIPNNPPGAKLLRKLLPEITSSITNPAGNILVTCDSGEHVAVCVALVLLCMYYDDEGGFGESGEKGVVVDKTYIRRRLAWITTAREGANPARAFLNGVNAFLMGGGR